LRTASHQNRSHYSALDGLRGLASLLVVIYHNFGFINHYFFFGWLGLDIFFVLSGFLITDILLSTVGNANYLRNFYARRILRVFPLYYVALLIFLLVLPNIKNIPLQLNYYVNHQAWLWFYLQNWLYVFYPSSSQSTLNHLWSLAVEEQFYLLWPLIIMALRKAKYILLFISLVLLLTIGLRYWAWVNHIENFAYYNLYTFTRIDGICVGCMVALLQRINPKFLVKNTAAIVSIFAGFNFLFYFFNRRYQFSFPYLAIIGYTTFAMLFGLLIYDMVNRQTKFFTSFFSVGILRFCGTVSYGCYIIHWPLYLATKHYLEQFAEQHIGCISPQFFASTIATLASYGIGYLSYRYFEMRFLKLKKYFN
jgi:peptidoglycan/LPS O-acetylase OafA/YrhL